MNTRIIAIFSMICLAAAVGACKDTANKTVSSTATGVVPSSIPATSPLTEAPAELGTDTIPVRSPDGALTRYGMQSGRIVMRYNGTVSGVRTIVFDQWGIRERTEDSSYSPGAKNPQLNRNFISISTKDFFMFAIKKDSAYQKMPNTMLGQFIHADSLKKKSFGREIVEHGPFKKRLPDTTINGYKCHVYGNDTLGIQTVFYFWRGIPLREHVTNQKDSIDFTIDAVEITPNVATTDAMFTLPSYYKEMGAPGGVRPPGGNAPPSGAQQVPPSRQQPPPAGSQQQPPPQAPPPSNQK